MAVTREHIADSFEKHIEQFGFRKTSVEDIAKDLHISKKTIYVHFESKDHIYRHVIERRAAEERRRIAAELAQVGTCAEKIEGLIGIIFEFTREWWRDNRNSEFALRFQVAEQAFHDAYTELIRDYVRSGVERGEFTAPDNEITVRFVGGVILAGTRMLQEDLDAEIEPYVVEAVKRLLTC